MDKAHSNPVQRQVQAENVRSSAAGTEHSVQLMLPVKAYPVQPIFSHVLVQDGHEIPFLAQFKRFNTPFLFQKNRPDSKA